MSQSETPRTQEEIDVELADDDWDELDEAIGNCSGFMDGGVFVCAAAGSEDCDWDCPFSRDIGLTLTQIEQRDLEEESSP